MTAAKTKLLPGTLLFWSASLLLALGVAAQGQVIINEVTCDPLAGQPVLSRSTIELWNQGQNPIDLTGWQMGVWAGDAGAIQTWVVPAATANGGGERVIFGRCRFLIGQETTTGNANFIEFYLPSSVRGLRVGNSWPWTTTSNLGVWFKDAQGNFVDYVYLRRGTTAAPPTPPHLPAGGTWTMGNLGTTAAGFGHLQRRANANTHSYADWEQTASNLPATWGAINTTGTATQTTLGPCNCYFQVNQAGSTIAAGGMMTNIVNSTNQLQFSPCAANVATLAFQSVNVGLPFDIGVTLAPKVTPLTGGFITPGQQIVNIDLGHPSFFFANGGTATTPFLGNSTVPVSIQYEVTITVQQVVQDPTLPDGFALSAPVQVDTLGYPLGSEALSGHAAVGIIALNSSADPGWAWCNTQLPFYGTSNTYLGVTTSGRLALFQGQIGVPQQAFDVSPSLASAMNGSPFAGVWCDLTVTSPTAFAIGSATLHAVSTGIVRLDFNHVGYTANPAVTCTFGVQFDQSTGVVQIDGLNGIQALPSVQQFIGISAGGLGAGGYGANNLGPAVFSPGFNAGPQIHGMVYAMGPAGTLTPGITIIQFVPNALGDYDYYCF